VMDADAWRMRGDKPFIFTNLKSGSGLEGVLRFIITEGMLPTEGLEATVASLPRIPPAPGSSQFPADTQLRSSL
jgi:hypothetical protein